MPFGVTLPDNLGETPTNTAPDTASGNSDGGAPEGAAPETVSTTKTPGTEAPDQAPKALTDLEKLERFRFEGREWTPKDLKRAYLRQEDYSRKTAELAETRKYSDNFASDLRTVIRNPARIEEFKRLYPKEFVARAEEILDSVRGGKSPESNAPTTTDPNSAFTTRIEALERQLAEQGEQRQAQEIEQIQSWLDNQFESNSKKYPFADSELVNSRAEAAARQGTKITAEYIETLFKAHNAQVKSKWDEHYKGTVQKQLSAGKEARDVGTGGGVPTEGPKKYRTMKEATAALLADLNSQK